MMPTMNTNCRGAGTSVLPCPKSTERGRARICRRSCTWRSTL